MKKRLFSLLSMAAVLMIQTMPLQSVQAAQVRVEETAGLLGTALEDMDNLEEGDYVEGEALVSLEASGNVALAQEGTYRLDQDITVESVNSFGTDEETGKETYLVHLTSDKYTTEELMEIALKQYYVDGVSANQYQHLLGTDPYQSYQWYLDGAGTGSTGISLSELTVTNKSTPVIAVIDTGVNYQHPDLVDSMWVNPYPDTLKGTYGYDFGEDDADPMDHYGHGTHVAGIAAATSGNDIGITGVSQAKIMALKVTTDDSAYITDASIIDAYGYVYDAIQAGVNVKAVNCSWGGSYDSNGILNTAVNRVGKAGALSVFAAGNDGVNWDNVNRALPTPYDLDSTYTVIVGASNEQDQAASYSDYAATKVDLFAPGSNILSTYTENLYLPGVYDSATQKKLSAYLNRFSDDATNILPAGQTWKSVYTAQELGIASDYSVKLQQLQDGSNGYLRLSVTRAGYTPGSEVAGSIYVDVTDLNLDQNATYYISYLSGESAGSDMLWEVGNMVSSPGNSRFVSVNNRTYMRIVGLQTDASYMGRAAVLYLDDIAISVADPDTESFGAYTYMEGTSMAAPVVSGALATLAAANPTQPVTSLRKLLLQSVRTVSGLSGKCITGGIIDMSKLVTLTTKVTLNKTSATLRYGKTLTLKAKVTPSYASNTKVKWSSSNTKYAIVTSNGVVKVKKAGIGHTVTITAKATDGSGKKATCKIKLLKKK